MSAQPHRPGGAHAVRGRFGASGAFALALVLGASTCTFNPDVDIGNLSCVDDQGCPVDYTCGLYPGRPGKACCKGKGGKCDEPPPAPKASRPGDDAGGAGAGGAGGAGAGGAGGAGASGGAGMSATGGNAGVGPAGADASAGAGGDASRGGSGGGSPLTTDGSPAADAADGGSRDGALGGAPGAGGMNGGAGGAPGNGGAAGGGNDGGGPAAGGAAGTGSGGAGGGSGMGGGNTGGGTGGASAGGTGGGGAGTGGGGTGGAGGASIDAPVASPDAAIDAPLAPDAPEPPTDALCAPACTLGNKRCGVVGLQECVAIAGCPSWGPDQACGGRRVCAGSEPSARCDCPARPAGCENGAGSFCSATTTLETCLVDADSCVYKGAATSCPTERPCTGTHPSASCSCPAPPAICNNTTGTFCDGGTNGVVTCTRDAQSCLVATPTKSCNAGKPCMGPAGSADCKCAAAPAECMGATSGNVCSSATTYVTCGANTDGCTVVTSSTGTCAGGSKPCAGAAGSAACACNTTPPPQCFVNGVFTVGYFCDGTGKRVHCTTDGNGCQIGAVPTSCAGSLTCQGAFPNAACSCPAAPAECMGATSGNVCTSTTTYVTCGTNGDGCVVVTNSGGTCPGGTKPCTGAAGSASCQCNTTPPAGCTAGSFMTGTFCDANGQVVQCSTDGNGCNSGSPGTACPSPQQCRGTLPSAACACPIVPECDAAGEINGSRCSANNLLTCAAQGACQQLTTTACPATGACVGTHPTSRCVDEEKTGWPTDTGNSEGHWTGSLSGIPITLTAPMQLRRFGIISRQATNSIILALYSDVAGSPSARIAYTGNTPLSVGVKEINVASPPGGLVLNPGTYWLMVSVSASTTSLGHVTSSMVTYKYVAWPHTDPSLPTTLSNIGQGAGTPTNFYIVGLPHQ